MEKEKVKDFNAEDAEDAETGRDCPTLMRRFLRAGLLTEAGALDDHDVLLADEVLGFAKSYASH